MDDRLHENAEMVVATYKYHRGTVSSKDLIETGMYADDQEQFLRVSKFVQDLSIDTSEDQKCPDWRHFIGAFENIRTLTLVNIAPDLFDVLPWELDKLVVCNPILDDSRSTEYIRRLNGTLLSLEIAEWTKDEQPDENHWQWLLELEKLRDLSVGVPIPQDIAKNLLERSLSSLERLKITFCMIENNWSLHEDTLMLMSTLENLKELDIQSESEIGDLGIDLVTNMLSSIGHKLHKLKLDLLLIDDEQFDWENLTHLVLDGEWNFTDLASLTRQMPNLRTLEAMWQSLVVCQDDVMVDGYEVSELVQLIEALPNLKELNLEFMLTSFEFEKELRQHLKQTNRKLQIGASE